MKRLIALLIALFFSLAIFASCGKKEEPKTEETATEQAAPAETTTADTTGGGGK